jgi:AcrR family transcriptional regulator
VNRTPGGSSSPAARTNAAVGPSGELPQVAGLRAERVDAARDRAAIIEAAERLLCDEGAEGITMDRLA